MKKYFELRNRENEFVAALKINSDSDCGDTQSSCYELFNSCIEENNWYEDQSLFNALSILRETALTVEDDIDLTVGVMEEPSVEKLLKNNIFKTFVEGDTAFITVNKETAKVLAEGNDIYVMLAANEESGF
jgi:hypothetical protein